MAGYPTILPDSIVTQDARSQLASFANVLGDPSVIAARKAVGDFAAGLPDLGKFLHLPGSDTSQSGGGPAPSPTPSPETPSPSATATIPPTDRGPTDDTSATSDNSTSNEAANQEVSPPADGTPAAAGGALPPAGGSAPPVPAARGDDTTSLRAKLAAFAQSLGDPTQNLLPKVSLSGPSLNSQPAAAAVLSPSTAATPSQPAAAALLPPAAAAPPAGQPAAGDVAGWRNVIQAQASPDLARDPAFVNTVLAGGMAESGLNPTRRQVGGNGVGFWQFDTGGGMGTGLSTAQLTSEAYQASKILPLYEAAWRSAPANLSPADKAAWVAVRAERPDDRGGVASARYRSAYATVSGVADSPLANGAIPQYPVTGIESTTSASPASPAPPVAASAAPNPSPGFTLAGLPQTALRVLEAAANPAGFAAANLPAIASAVPAALNAPAQLARAALVSPSGRATTPGDLTGYGATLGANLQRGFSMADPNAPILDRAGQALAVASQPFEDQVGQTTQQLQSVDPTGGLGGGFSLAAHLGTNPLTYAAPLTPEMLGGTALGGLAGYGLSRATGASPADTTANVETGGNLGLLAGGIAPGAIAAARTVGPIFGQGLRDLGETARGFGLTPGLSIAPVDDAAASAATQGAASSRFYHGTGTPFETPDANTFDPNGLFGPGYYLTSDPRVAGEYAAMGSGGGSAASNLAKILHLQTDIATLRESATQSVYYPPSQIRWWTSVRIPELEAQLAELRKAAEVYPNVRAVNVPADLKLLQADAPIPDGLEETVADHLAASSADMADRFAESLGGDTGRDLYRALVGAGEGDKQWANAQLQQLGYDGIAHAAGRGLPVRDDSGQPIQHTVNVIFPESMGKLTNAISGTRFGSAPAIGGALVGGYTGSQQGDTPQERARNALKGAALGGIGGYLAGRGDVVPGMSIKPIDDVGAALNEWLAPARNTPPEVQDALRELANARLQAQVDGQTWMMRAKSALGADDSAAAASRFEQTGQFVANPNPAQKQLAAEADQYLQQTGNLGRQNGYVQGNPVAAGTVPHYFPHLYDDTTGVGNVQVGGRNLNPKDFYSQARQFPDLATAIANGRVPVDSVSGPLGHYALHIQNSEAESRMVDALQHASPAAAMPIAPGTRPPAGWTTSKVPQLNGYAFPQPVAKAIDNILAPAWGQGTAITRALTGGLGAAKETLFSLSGFHLLTELRQSFRANGVRGLPVVADAVQHAILPGAYKEFRLANADAFSQAADAGVTGLTGGGSADLGATPEPGFFSASQGVRALAGGLATGASRYAVGQSAGEDPKASLAEALKYGAAGALLGPTAGKLISDGLWERAIPTLKVLSYHIARQDPAIGPRAAATFVNQTYGGNNLAAIARDPAFQGVARLTTMAPDWWEGWVRQLGGVFNPGEIGKLSRSYALRTAVVDGAFTLEGLNYGLNGHFTTQNDPGHQADLELTGLYDKMGWKHVDANGQPQNVYLDILGPLKSIASIGLNPQGPIAGAEAFGKGHASIPWNVGTAAWTNTDWRGKPIVQPGTDPATGVAQTVGYGLSQVAPVGAQAVDQAASRAEPLPVQLASTLTGMRVSRQSNATQRFPMQLPQSSRDIIRQFGLYYNPTPAPGSLRGVILSQPEVNRYVALYTQQMDKNLHVLAADPSFAHLTTVQKNHAVTLQDARAAKFAEGTIIGQIGSAEFARRLAQHNAAAPVTP